MRGVREDSYGYQAYVRVRRRFVSRRFPKETPLSVMRDWRVQARARALLGQSESRSPTFSDDASDYLKAVRAMPSYAHREVDIDRWRDIFGDRPRTCITAVEIRTILEQWRQRYAASTVNHRRTALMHLWTVLDGKSAPNPVKDVPRYRETPRAPRILAPALIAEILEQMGDSPTKARLSLMAWTGWPHTQIRNLEPTDIKWDEAVYVRPRAKGGGIEGRWLPLLPKAWEALRAFKRVGAWGRFSSSSLRKSLRLAAQKVDPSLDVTPYDLRHAFLTWVAVIAKDDRVVATLGLHRDERMTKRYTAASVDPRVTAALATLATLGVEKRGRTGTNVKRKTAKSRRK